jgi:predicted homoserine dehydrogenase-like protein
MNFYAMLQQRAAQQRPVKVGVIGAGKFATMFLSQARLVPGFQITGIADLAPARALDALQRTGWPEGVAREVQTAEQINDAAANGKIGICEDASQIIAADCEVVLEITGHPEAGTRHALACIDGGKHVVMVNVEADCLLGPALQHKAAAADVVYSMAYGDQPALIMEQIDWARTVGFDIVCAGKGTRYQPEFHYSTPETVWGFYGFSEAQVASGDYNAQMFNSFLDGSKSAIEMCAVANASGLLPPEDGLKFPPVSVEDLAEVLKPKADGGILDHAGMVEVIASEDRQGRPVPGDLRWGVYVVLGAPTAYVRRCFKDYGMKTDSTGRYSALYRPYHYIGLELGISVASAALRCEPTGVSRQFVADVAATAKKDLAPGEILDGEGGYTVFGKLTSASNSLARAALPLGLTGGAKMVKAVTKGQILTYDDVLIDEASQAYRLRREMESQNDVMR